MLDVLLAGGADVTVGPRPTQNYEHTEVLGREEIVLLPQPALRTASPRTAAQLAAAGMGVTLVPFSALTPLPGATIRSLDPPELRDVAVVVAAPHDELLRRFVADLKRRGLPDSRLSRTGSRSGAVRAISAYAS